jgi:hypothetical protein
MVVDNVSFDKEIDSPNFSDQTRVYVNGTESTTKVYASTLLANSTFNFSLGAIVPINSGVDSEILFGNSDSYYFKVTLNVSAIRGIGSSNPYPNTITIPFSGDSNDPAGNVTLNVRWK